MYTRFSAPYLTLSSRYKSYWSVERAASQHITSLNVSCVRCNKHVLEKIRELNTRLLCVFMGFFRGSFMLNILYN